MKHIRPATLFVVIVVGIAVLGGIFLVYSGKLPQTEREQQEQVLGEQEVRLVTGQVTSVDVAANSFVLLLAQEERSFTVLLGQDTEFIRLIFPFDVNNPPPDVNFAPEREPVTIEDLRTGDQVFVRSETSIIPGKDIVNPLEVQILP